jgi:YggT family protein
MVLLLLSLVYFFLSLAFLSRLILQWRRVNDQNPISQLVMTVTQPVIRLLQPIFPVVRHVNLACLVVFLAIQLGYVLLFNLLAPDQAPGFIGATLEYVLDFYFWMIIIVSVFSFIPNGTYHPLAQIANTITLPILAPLRKRLPLVGGTLDLSPLVAIVIIILLKGLIAELNL